MKMKKWMGACLMASMVLSQTPTMVLAQEFEDTLVEEMGQTDLVVENEDEKVEGENVAEFNGTEYKTLQDAINAAKDATDENKTIILAANTTEDISIPEGLTLTLQINQGVTLTNKSENTIKVNLGATLAIMGKGTVENKSNEKTPLYNLGTITLDGGITITRPEDEAGNSYYTVLNHGIMTINEATIYNDGESSSCIENIGINDDIVATINVNNGASISGGLNAIKNDGNSTVKITGGTVSNSAQNAILNYDEVIISGGKIESTCTLDNTAAIFNRSTTDSKGSLQYYKGKVTIVGDPVIKGLNVIINEIYKGKYQLDSHPYNGVEINGGTLIGTNGALKAKKNTNITINGGVIIGGEGQFEGEKNVVEQEQGANVRVSAGTLKGKLQINDSSKVSVSGGTFISEIPEEVWTDGFVQSKNPDGSFASHTLQKVTGKSASCTEDGFADYWKCTDPNCGQMFSDDKGKTKIDKPIVFPATGHTYTWVIDKEPTKDHAGAKYQYCMVCHHKTNPVSIPAIGYTEKVESAVYRAYNPNNGEHLYTANYDEFRTITSIGWHDEGIAFMTESAKDGYPLYRVYNLNSGLHHYTIDENEKNVLVSLGWRDEDVTMYTSKKPQCAAVFRVYNPNGGQHHYTKDANERNVLVSLGWKDEGIAFRTAEIPSK